MTTSQSTTLYEGRFLRLQKVEQWEFAERTNATRAVAIVALTPDSEILFVEQFRPPVNSNVIELPAGLVGDETEGEDELVAAGRELIEETGYRAGSLEFIMGGPVSAGMSSEVIDFVRARNLEREHEGGGVDGEDITVHAIPLSKAGTWLQNQRGRVLVDPKVYAGVFFAMEF